ncbi:MAG: hypothetical protein Q8M66_02510, partial [Actinomycetota bacterium]|nr:hypothetical protein [Actinomycetota bacterium]
ESDAAAMIRFLPFVPRHRALRLMLGANALLLLVSRELAYAATGKVFDYIASRTPVIALVPPGIAASVVSSAGGEVVCDAAGLAQSLHRLTGGQVSHRPEPPDSSLVGYAARSLAAQLDAELEAACDIHGGQA